MLYSVLGGLLVALACSVQAAPIAGLDYEVLQRPQPVESAGKVEVIEFFWYRCPHCYHLEPMLETWVKNLPADARFRRVPVVFNDDWAIDARIFYTLEALGQLERVHRALYEAIDAEGARRMSKNEYIKWTSAWLARQGVDMAAYQKTSESSAIAEKVAKARAMTKAYGVEGTPTFSVQGRYVIGAGIGDHGKLLKVTSELIEQARHQPVAAR
jgi:protein dithiol oxidoreductase (disulfide-forming)